jgi:DNA polymerase-3 subunit gamma/tau
MAYQVIARKYRPQRFDDVVGQEHVTQTLANAIEQGRIAHAYLFVGPRGTGKTTIARIFAKCLNCTDGPKVDFADEDSRCLEISEGRSLDVLEIDGASNRGIEDVRELRETVKYAPASSRFKVYIIDEVHMLTKEAFNALLKTLEEPPAHVKFMFATTEPEKVLPTILSRCQRFDLRRIPIPLIVKHLAYIAGAETVEIEEAALLAIARGAEGCMRDAESTLDQLISFCGNRIVEGDVLSMFGMTARSQVHAMARAILEGEAAQLLKHLDGLVKNGKDLGRLLSDLLGHFRNLLIYKLSQGDTCLLEVVEADAAALASQVDGASTEGLTRILEALVDCESRLRDSVSKRIAFEVGLLKALEMRNAVSLDQVLRSLRQLRTGAPTLPSGDAGASAPATNTTRPKSAETAPVPQQAEAKPSLPSEENATAQNSEQPRCGSGDLEGIWSQLVEAVGRMSPFVRSYLAQTHPVSWKNKVLTIGYCPEMADQIELLDSPKNRNLVLATLKEIGWDECQVKYVKVAGSDSALVPSTEKTTGVSAAGKTPMANRPPAKAVMEKRSETARPAPLDPGEFKNDPLIQRALEVFKGHIAGIQRPNEGANG